MQKYFLVLFVLTTSLLCAKHTEKDKALVGSSAIPPWLTGPIVAPSGHVMPYGHINYEPYLFWYQKRGTYNAEWHDIKSLHIFNQLNINPTFQCGIAPNTEFDFAPQIFYNHTQNQAKWVWGDMPISFAWQLLNDKRGKWWPAIKLKLNGNIPWGKYQHLNPKKLTTDDGGSGSWSPGMGIVLSHLYHFHGVHYLNARWYNAYTMPTPVHVKGFSNYGGAKNTRAKVFPGHSFISDVGLEYTLAQTWALAFDVVYIHQNKTRFSGNGGTNAGIPVSLTSPSSEQISLAPALEYNWSSTVGMIGGAWVTIAGRNASKFVQWIIAINIYV